MPTASRKSSLTPQLRSLDIVRIFDYGLNGFAPPEVARSLDARPPLMALSHRRPGVRPSLTIGRRLDIAWRHAFPGRPVCC